MRYQQAALRTARQVNELRQETVAALGRVKNSMQCAGASYPGAILIKARIVSVADVVETMPSHRLYRTRLGIDAVLAEFTAKRGVHLIYRSWMTA